MGADLQCCEHRSERVSHPSVGDKIVMSEVLASGENVMLPGFKIKPRP